MGRLFKEFASFSVFTLIARIFGFLRDVVIAYKVGAGAASDIFFVALKFPNFFRRVFAEGALTQSFVPIYSGLLEKNKEKAQSFSASVLFFLGLVTLILTIIVQIFTVPIMSFFAPGFLDDPVKFFAVVEATRITFPYLIFISIVSLYSAMLYSHRLFSAGAIVPIIFNLGLIFGILFFAGAGDNYSVTMSYSLLIAGLLQLVFILLFILKRRIFILPKMKVSSEFKDFIKRLLPAALAASVVQLNVWVDTIFASQIPNSISYLYYSDRLVQLPMALIGTSLAIVLLPKISRELTRGNIGETLATTEKAILVALFFGAPASFALFILADDVIQILFMRGAFTLTEVFACSEAMKILVFSMPAYILLKIILTHFHARGDMKTPMYVSLIAVLINIIFNYILVKKYSYLGIAKATVISAWVNYLLLLVIALRRDYFRFSFELVMQIIKFACATLIMSIITLKLSDFFYPQIQEADFMSALYLSLVIIVALISYFSASFILLGKKQLRQLISF